MHDHMSMTIIDAWYDLLEKSARLIFLQFAVFNNIIEQLSSRDVFHYHKYICGRTYDLISVYVKETLKFGLHKQFIKKVAHTVNMKNKHVCILRIFSFIYFQSNEKNYKKLAIVPYCIWKRKNMPAIFHLYKNVFQKVKMYPNRNVIKK